MSATPTRIDWDATAAETANPLQEGNRVLESIARQEALPALQAFSGLHLQIRNRQMATGGTPDRDLFETERFILDEVLQLICDRAQTLTRADGVVIALVAGADVVCRASAGALSVERGTRLIGDSEILQDCLESGRILRSDDCEIDARVELDFARQIGARATLLVPLRGRREQLGVLQALSSTPWAFTDHDIRSFDLFAELVLSALKPEDQDRRIHWLSDVASEVLQAKPADAAAIVESATTSAIAELAASQILAAKNPVAKEAEPVAAALVAAAPSNEEKAETLPAVPAVLELVIPSAPTVVRAATAAVPDSGPEVNSPVADELPEVRTECSADVTHELVTDDLPSDDFVAYDAAKNAATAVEIAPRVLLPFPGRISPAVGSRPGLALVAGLIAVGALFSAGAWWGMQAHEKTGSARATTAKTFLPSDGMQLSPVSVNTPPAPSSAVLSPSVSDNLLGAEKAGSEVTALEPVPADKLAALPKVTGVRHWSSSMGSTVVIDMEDQVPYEVHRLMSPERIYFDLHDTVLKRELDGATMEVGDASLSRVRIAQPVAGVTRIVLDTRDGSNFSVSMESNPYRLVVELRGSEKNLAGSHLASNRLAPNAPIAAKAVPMAALAARTADQTMPAKTGRFRIVLDAGHGGWDLGTVGRQGLLEKDLVLDVTQRLGKLLQARLGSDVTFTRTGDSYLPLDQRADIANQAQADLFVSVHANYSSSAAARGVETYYTNLFSAPGSREIEKHDDGTLAKFTPVTLSAGGLHEKIEESRRLATNVQHSLYATLAAGSPDIRNRGIKDASFAVLTGTTMPSILTEISFVSSPADERALQSASYRQQIAEALYQGIARYEQTSPRTRVAQLQTTASRR